MNAHGKIAKTTTVKPAFTLIVGVKKINAEIDALAVTGKEYQSRLHVLACSVLKHVAHHRNTTVLEHFLDSVPVAVRVNSLKQWFETFGNVSFSAVEGAGKPIWRMDDTKQVRLGNAMEKPFWKFKANEGMPYQPLNMDTFVKQMVNKLEKDAKETGVDHSAMINALKAHKTQVTTANPN